MRAQYGNTTSHQLANTWALGVAGAASGSFRRMLSPWAYKHLRGLAATHFAVGVLLAGVAAMLVSRGLPGWAALPLAGTVLHFLIGYAEVVVDRTAASRA